jgi:hypothetical protein
MADIFLSYTERDRDTVRRLADMLQAVGWSVWWDRRIPAGQTWRSVLDRELQSMHCMVVLWSSRSVKSDWVCEEAAEARQLGRLVPVLIEQVRPPAGFREVQAADLVVWDGARDFPGLQQLISDIEQMIGKPGAAPREMSQPQSAMPTDAAADRPIASGRHHRVPVDMPIHPPIPPSPRRHLLAWGAAAGVLLIAGAAYLGTVWRDPAPVIPQPNVAPTPAPSPVVNAPVVPPHESKDKPPSAATHPVVEQPLPNPPIAKRPDVPPRPIIKPIARLPASSNPRCAALTERLALGETLSHDSQVFLNQECRK